MSLFGKTSPNAKEIEKSQKLVGKERELEGKFPEIEKTWNDEDTKFVRLAAEELAIVSLTGNRDALLEAQENLKHAKWKRDAPREAHQREMEQITAEIEELNIPVINKKCEEWRVDLRLLRGKKIAEIIEKRHTVDVGIRIIYKSNFEMVETAKEKLLTAISTLRGMRLASLAEIYKFIEKTEVELGSLDFTALKKEKDEVTETYFQEITAPADVQVIQTHSHILVGDKIIPTYSPQRKVERG